MPVEKEEVEWKEQINQSFIVLTVTRTVTKSPSVLKRLGTQNGGEIMLSLMVVHDVAKLEEETTADNEPMQRSPNLRKHCHIFYSNVYC